MEVEEEPLYLISVEGKLTGSPSDSPLMAGEEEDS